MQQLSGGGSGAGFFDAAQSGYSLSSLTRSNSTFNSQRMGLGGSMYDGGSDLFLGGSTGINSYSSLAQLNLGSGGIQDSGEIPQAQQAGIVNNAAEVGDQGGGQNGGRRGHGYRMLWEQVTRVGQGETLSSTPPCGMTVEDLHRTIRSLQPDQSAVEAVRMGLQYLDSSATAALLKELHKTGMGHRAVELFDWLRTLDNSDDLRSLCDVKTYTTAISMCTNHQQLRRALELVAEMKSRGVQCNVHTYSALMNVCNKCNELELALDVFNQLKKEGIQPSLVTYNTLIEIYGKRQQWEESLAVLDALYEAQISAEVRTYNQVISVCNRAGHPDEALKVYHRMVAAGVQPSATTYTTLISAYGKQGQLQQALDIFHDMVSRNCERNVITYSSLISACEKVGDVQTALALFQEMQKENVPPNVLTFNSLISVCANVGQWQNSCEFFDQMLQFHCRPDKITYVNIFTALQKGGHWPRAIKTYQVMISQGVKGDSVIYNQLLDTLWSSGIAKVQVRALQLWVQGVQSSSFRISKHHSRETNRIEYSVTAITPGAAIVNVLQWLADVSTKIGQDPTVANTQLVLTLSCQRARQGQAEQVIQQIQQAVQDMLNAHSCPTTVSVSPVGVQLFVMATGLYSWMMSEFFSQCISLVFESRMKRVTDDELLGENMVLEAKCREAFQLVLDYESRHVVDQSRVSKEMIAQRPQMVQQALKFARQLSFGREIAHDGLQLADRVVCCGFSASLDLLPLFICSCVVIAGLKGQSIETLWKTISQATGFETDALRKMQNDIKQILGNDVAAVAPTRVAHVYLERLGLPTVCQKNGIYGETLVQGINNLLDSVASDPQMMVFPPSKMAACVTSAVRQCLGYTPSWPSALADMTGFKSMQDEGVKDIFLAVQNLLRQVSEQVASGSIQQENSSSTSVSAVQNTQAYAGVVYNQQHASGSLPTSLTNGVPTTNSSTSNVGNGASGTISSSGISTGAIQASFAMAAPFTPHTL